MLWVLAGAAERDCQAFCAKLDAVVSLVHHCQGGPANFGQLYSWLGCVPIRPGEQEGCDSIAVLTNPDPSFRVVSTKHCSASCARHHNRSAHAIDTAVEGVSIPSTLVGRVAELQALGFELGPCEEGAEDGHGLVVALDRLGKLSDGGGIYLWELLGRHTLHPHRLLVLQNLLPMLAKNPHHQPLDEVRFLLLGVEFPAAAQGAAALPR
mmetsp:Transcript_1642/g.4728  ORF Transcript_1642/g.4728 Transcript_1642/m.4728 type:complete len:209 (+) Transcript_1642:308-934(+)